MSKYLISIIAFSLFPLQVFGQTMIIYTYDSAGNRTERSASVQTLAGVTDNTSVESVAISVIAVQLMTTTVIDVLLSKEADSIPDRRETALWAACPFPDEQNRSLSLTKGIAGLPGRQNQPPMLTKRR